MSKKDKRPVGRPPSDPIFIPYSVIEALTQQSRELARSRSKLKKWLGPKRIFHVLLQDHLATLAIPGIKGMLQNAASSKLFLDVSEPLAAALDDAGIPDDEDDDNFEPELVREAREKNERKVKGRVGNAAQRQRSSKRRKSSR